MKNHYIALLAAAVLPCLTGCVSSPLELASVGPGVSRPPATAGEGYLEVFTATRTAEVDFESYFNPHTSYTVTDAAGRSVKYVENHTSDMDEWPDLVTLPPGTYHVVAESAWCGLVTVPVVVQPGATTVVHLDGKWGPPSRPAAGQLVFLPNGQPVGWSSPATR
jgi:hypothetical protein